MNITSVHPPLSNVQAELLKVFSADIADEYLVGLKNTMARFLLDNARDKADAAWDEKEYSDEKLQQLLSK